MGRLGATRKGPTRPDPDRTKAFGGPFPDNLLPRRYIQPPVKRLGSGIDLLTET